MSRRKLLDRVASPFKVQMHVSGGCRNTFWEEDMKKLTITIATLASTMIASPVFADGHTSQLATVVKIDGIAWFNRMREGVDEWATETGNNAYLVGPAQADPQQQVALIEDMIAQGVDALLVVPMSPEAIEPVLGRAIEAGITVITHEAASQENTFYNIEAFKNEDFGANLMDRMASCMGQEGEYAVFVGSLGSQTHNQWVDGAIARQQQAYPNMTLVGDKNETADDQQQAYAKAQEVLRAFPNIKGLQGSASTDVAGIGLAIEERGMEADTCVFGTSLPSISGQYMETGAVDGIGFWDPKIAGIAMNVVAMMVMNGDEISDGMDLGLEGYEDVTLEGKVITGNAFVDVDASNMGEYDF
jgi:simple sugar transport system substrate-binding protein